MIYITSEQPSSFYFHFFLIFLLFLVYMILKDKKWVLKIIVMIIEQVLTWPE